MILIRHSAVDIDPTAVSTDWQLSENGRFLTKALAHQYLNHKPHRILTSTEQKAIETGQILGDAWQIPCQAFPNLHEHERSQNDFVSSKEEWLNMVERFLTQQNELVLGVETAVQAANRFKNAIQSAQAKFPDETLAFVSHGRILTAFLSQHNPQIEPVTFWQTLKLPDAILINPITYEITERIRQ